MSIYSDLIMEDTKALLEEIAFSLYLLSNREMSSDEREREKKRWLNSFYHAKSEAESYYDSDEYELYC